MYIVSSNDLIEASTIREMVSVVTDRSSNLFRLRCVLEMYRASKKFSIQIFASAFDRHETKNFQSFKTKNDKRRDQNGGLNASSKSCDLQKSYVKVTKIRKCCYKYFWIFLNIFNIFFILILLFQYFNIFQYCFNILIFFNIVSIF